MKKNRLARFCGLASALTLAAVVPASAAIDISDATAAVTEAEGHITTLGGAAIGIAVLFLGFRLVRKAINKVS